MYKLSFLLLMFLLFPLIVQAQDDDMVDHYFGENYDLRSRIDDLIDDEAHDSTSTIVLGLEKLAVCKDERHQVWALNKLSDLYFKGFGPIDKDIAMAIKYNQKAIDLNSHLAMSRLATCMFLGLGMEKDLSQGLALAKKANELSKSNSFASSMAKRKDGGMYDDLVEKMEQALAKEQK